MYALYVTWAMVPLSLSRLRRHWPLGASVLFLAALSAIAVLQPDELNKDREIYRWMIQGVAQDGELLMEPGFFALTRLLGLAFNGPALELVFFFTVSLVSLLIKLRLFKQYGHSLALCCASFISYYFMVHEMTQVRTGLAIGLLYFSWYRYAAKDIRHYLLYGLLSSMFHLSCVVFLLAPVFRFGTPLRKWWWSTLPVLALSLVIAALGKNVFFLLSDAGALAGMDRVTIYLALLDEDILSAISPLRLIPHLLLMGIALSVQRKWRSDRITLITFQVYAMGALLFVLFSPIPALAYRVSDLFLFAGVMLLGRLSKHFPSALYPVFAFFYTGASLLYTINISGIFFTNS